MRHVVTQSSPVAPLRVATILLTALAGAGIAAPAQAQDAASCGRAPMAGVAQELSSGGRTRTYRLFVPDGVPAGARLPLVLDLHPSGGTIAGQVKTSGFETLAARERFAVATLQAEGGRWNVPVADGRPDDVRYVSDVIDHVAARVCIDPSRVYAAGFSGGARMSSLLACRLNDRITAIAPMAGLRWPGPCEGRPVPILTLHGLADPQNTYEGGATGRGAEWVESVPDALAGWARHNGCRGDAIEEDPAGPLSTLRYADCRESAEVRLIRIDGHGHSWVRDPVDATSTMWQFFRNHARSR
jgi:polyhydroxybutyrate depolymerase